MISMEVLRERESACCSGRKTRRYLELERAEMDAGGDEIAEGGWQVLTGNPHPVILIP